MESDLNKGGVRKLSLQAEGFLAGREDGPRKPGEFRPDGEKCDFLLDFLKTSVNLSGSVDRGAHAGNSKRAAAISRRSGRSEKALREAALSPYDGSRRAMKRL